MGFQERERLGCLLALLIKCVFVGLLIEKFRVETSVLDDQDSCANNNSKKRLIKSDLCIFYYFFGYEDKTLFIAVMNYSRLTVPGFVD